MIDSRASSLVSARNKKSLFVLQDLKQVFIQETPKILKKMNQGFRDRDYSLILRSAQTLRNSCRYLGLVEMSEICEQLEAWAQKANASHLEAFIFLQHLERAYRKAVVELKKAVNNLQGGFHVLS